MILKFAIKLMVMFSLMLLALGLEKGGAIDYISRCFKTRRSALILWYFISCLLTAVIPDTMVAVTLLPIVVLLSKIFNMETDKSLLVTSFGIVSGDDLTYFGGGDNIVGRTLVEKFTGNSIDMGTWSNLFLMPTIIQVVVVFIILYLLIIRHVDNEQILHEECSRPSLIPVVAFLVACTLALISEAYWPVIILIAVISSLYIGLGRKELSRLPYKALYLWTGAMLLGNVFDIFIKSYAAGYYISPQPILLLVVLGGLTNIITNTGLTSAVLPTLMNLTDNNMLVFMLSVKAIGLSYITILANGCLAVASSYGLNQKKLLATGFKVWLVLIIIFSIYFTTIW